MLCIRSEHLNTSMQKKASVIGQKAVRGKTKFVDYLLIYKNVPVAVVEAKDNNQSIGAGMQQGLGYQSTSFQVAKTNSKAAFPVSVHWTRSSS